MTPLFYHPDQDCTDTFSFISVAKIPEFVRRADRKYQIPQMITEGHIVAAHDVDFVKGVLNRTRDNGFGNRDERVLKSILASNSNFLAAARYAHGHGVAASATQGFHHSHFDNCYGYCTFNGLMIAALDLLISGKVRKVLIIDGDGHHGDGTDDIIDRNGLSKSVTNITSATMNGLVNDFDASDWYEYTLGLIEKHNPGIIMYQAGADAWEGDPYGVGYLDEMDLMRRDTGIMRAARYRMVPLVWNLAGGYTTPMKKVIDIHLNTLMMSDRVYYGTV